MKELTVTEFKITRLYTVIESYSNGYLCTRDDGKTEFVEIEQVETLTESNKVELCKS